MTSGTPEQLFKEGIRLFKEGEYQQSVDIFSELLDLDSENHKAWNAYGVVLHKLG